MKLYITFKNNEREKRLFNEVNGKINKSAFVKECIEFYLNNTGNNNNTNIISNDINGQKNDLPKVDWEDML